MLTPTTKTYDSLNHAYAFFNTTPVKIGGDYVTLRKYSAWVSPT